AESVDGERSGGVCVGDRIMSPDRPALGAAGRGPVDDDEEILLPPPVRGCEESIGPQSSHRPAPWGVAGEDRRGLAPVHLREGLALGPRAAGRNWHEPE